MKGGALMPSLRQEVHEFVRASETLLSPASLDAPLSKEELRIIEFYASSLTSFCAGLGEGEGDGTDKEL